MLKVVSPVLDQYRLGVNRLQVAMELGGLARRVNLPLGVEVRLLYGWTILDGLREGEQEEVRELALSMLQVSTTPLHTHLAKCTLEV